MNIEQGSCRYQIEDKTNNETIKETGQQSDELLKADLIVSDHKYKHHKMFGTLVGEDKKDPCSGDSGGPLMYRDKESGRWVAIGQF